MGIRYDLTRKMKDKLPEEMSLRYTGTNIETHYPGVRSKTGTFNRNRKAMEKIRPKKDG